MILDKEEAAVRTIGSDFRVTQENGYRISFLDRNIQVSVVVGKRLQVEVSVILHDGEERVSIGIAILRGNLFPDPLVWRDASVPRLMPESPCRFVVQPDPHIQRFRNGSDLAFAGLFFRIGQESVHHAALLIGAQAAKAKAS